VNLGASELLVICLLLAFFGLPLWAIIDLAIRPSEAFKQARQSRPAWLLGIILLIPVGGLGALLAVVYLAWARPKVAATHGHLGTSTA
jgi:hypothetical protein